MKKRYKLLEEWVGQKLITAAQKENIIAYEEGRNKQTKPKWILYGFLILGACVIGIGIISIIAANWEDIPGAAKLAASFIILSGIAFWIYINTGEGRDVYFDTLAVLFSVLCLAMIGLISQVYHTGGELYQALFFWLVIIFPLAKIGTRNFLPNLWVVGFIYMTQYFMYSYMSASSMFSSDEDIIVMSMTLPFLCLSMGNAGSFLKKFRGLEWTGRFGNIFLFWAVLGIIWIIGAMDTIVSFGEAIEFRFQSILFFYFFIFTALVFLWLSGIFSRREKILITIILAVIFLASLPVKTGEDGNYSTILMIIAYQDRYSDSLPAGQLLGPLFSIPLVVLISMVFIIRDYRLLFNLATLAIGIRFLIVYFQVFGDLATTGLGLVVSGLIIIGISLLWFSKRTAIEKLFKELLK